MADQLLHQQSDDAPLATSKQRDAVERAKASIPEASGTQITARAVTINRPVAEVFAFFRDFANFPSFREKVERIDLLDPQRSHWVVKAPAGGTDSARVFLFPGRIRPPFRPAAGPGRRA